MYVGAELQLHGIEKQEGVSMVCKVIHCYILPMNHLIAELYSNSFTLRKKNVMCVVF